MSQKITFPLCLVIYLHIVSISIPENPKALSPWMDITLFPGAWSLHQIPAATANPNPTPIVPKLPASSLQAKQRTPAYLKLFVYVCNEYLHIICRFEVPLDPCPFQLHEPACRRCVCWCLNVMYLPVSWEVIGNHGSADVHCVGSFTDYYAVLGEKLLYL